MSEYQSIEPANVREGDVVRAKYDKAQYPATIEGVVYESMNDDDDRLFVGGYAILGSTDLRLISRPAPPEPPLRVGDFVRHECGNDECPNFQITEGTLDQCRRNADHYTRVEPPVGWPVAVPDPDAPGAVRWYRRAAVWYSCATPGWDNLTWPELVARGGIPALAPGGAA